VFRYSSASKGGGRTLILSIPPISRSSWDNASERFQFQTDAADALAPTASCATLPRPAAPAHPRAREIHRQRSDLAAHAPPGNEGARERRIREIERDHIVQHQAHPGRCHGPAIGTAILVEPSGHLRVALAKPVGRNANRDADGKSPLGPARPAALAVTPRGVFLVTRVRVWVACVGAAGNEVA
jgi:hypothetical protein